MTTQNNSDKARNTHKKIWTNVSRNHRAGLGSVVQRCPRKKRRSTPRCPTINASYLQRLLHGNLDIRALHMNAATANQGTHFFA